MTLTMDDTQITTLEQIKQVLKGAQMTRLLLKYLLEGVICPTRADVHQDAQRLYSIGVRRKPDPRGRQGYLRVDTVH